MSFQFLLCILFVKLDDIFSIPGKVLLNQLIKKTGDREETIETNTNLSFYFRQALNF
jgi:transcriptional regulatory protein LevR